MTTLTFLCQVSHCISDGGYHGPKTAITFMHPIDRHLKIQVDVKFKNNISTINKKFITEYVRT